MSGNSVRVLHYIKHLETGGGESLIFNIYQNIDREKVQFDFAVNTKDEERLDEQIRGMGGRIYPIIDKEPKSVVLKLRKTSAAFKMLLKEKHYDIVHIHCSNGQGLYYSDIARKGGIKNVIVHIHNTSIVGYFEKFKTIVHNNFRKKYMKAPTEYMACSLAAAKWLYDENVINGEHYRLLKNGIDVERFKFSEIDRELMRAKLGFEDKKVICTIGRCVKEKNQIFVLKVLRKLLQKNFDYRLILIGQGKLEEALKAYAKANYMEDKVAFVKSTDEVEKYLSASDSFLLSSSSEGLGIVAIEAQANGLQTIVSDNVPDDVLLSPYSVKLDLSAGEEQWANEIICWKGIDENRKDAGKYITRAGYEIRNVADEIQEFYLKLIT